MSECVFCSEEPGGGNEIARTDLFRARWDNYPATPGHVEVLPLRHVQLFDELTQEELSEMMVFTKTVIEIVRQTNLSELYDHLRNTVPNDAQTFVDSAIENSRKLGKPDAYNLGLNDGLDAGQSVPHLHMHILPRWKGDVSHPRGGVRNIFDKDAYGSMS